MLLAELDELFDVLEAEERLPPRGFKPRGVRFTIELDVGGALVGVTDAGGEPPARLVPDLGRSGSDPAALPIVDNGKFVLGMPKAITDDRGAAERAHAAYVRRLEDLLTYVSAHDRDVAKAISVIRAFVSDAAHARRQVEERLGAPFAPNAKGELVEASANFRFRVDGIDPTEDPVLREWWASQVEDNLGTGVEGTCQITGHRTEIARLTPRISMRQGKEALVSANFAAAERYHASQSSGASLGVAAVIRSHQALNWLLADRAHHKRLGELTYVWWAPDALDFDSITNVIDPDPQQIAALLSSPFSGVRRGLHDAPFRLLELALAEARVVVRSDHTVSLSSVQRRVTTWFTLVERPAWMRGRRYPGVVDLAKAGAPPGEGRAATVRRDRIVASLMESVITGVALPPLVMNAAVHRCRAESGVTPDRAALLRLCRRSKEDHITMTESKGTMCGRVLAVLEWAQYAALGETNRTVVDRYYAAASATPQRVFSSLFRDARAHLSKAARQNKGTEVVISRRLSELAEKLAQVGGFPPRLTVADQADFALGYWQERQRRFERKKDDTTNGDDDD